MIKAKKVKKVNLEDQHQMALMRWARSARVPAFGYVPAGAKVADFLIHIPNGGSRHPVEAVKLKAMGTKAGVSDLFFAVPGGCKAGLWIELKAPFTSSKDKNYPTKEQREWMQKMDAAGYGAQLCYGWDQAKEAITNYMQGI
ncbi:VRR-NUC domain-containing protein [Shewanella sp.]|uniref:VRR-NUC domain-containing protein n=1 Tax=Shewanella sp. TaxID=50422 RepID=UPI003F2B96FC